MVLQFNNEMENITNLKAGLKCFNGILKLVCSFQVCILSVLNYLTI